MWFSDDDLESTNANWKNSEVIRTFAENFIDRKMVEKRTTQDSSSNDSISEVGETGVTSLSWLDSSPVSDIELAAFAQQVREYEELDLLVESLADLAGESVKYGNEKATYMIERTMEEIRALKSGEVNAI